MSLHGPAGACIPVASASPIHVFPIQRVLKHCGAHKHIYIYKKLEKSHPALYIYINIYKKLEKSHPALAIFDCFRGQSTPGFFSVLEKYNIISIQVLANCTDHLQSLDVSVNKPAHKR